MPKNMHSAGIDGLKMKFEDPLHELRKIRESHSEQFDYDLDQIVADIQRIRNEDSVKDWKFVKRRKHANQSVEITDVKHINS